MFQEILERNTRLFQDSTESPERQLSVKRLRATDCTRFRFLPQDYLASPLASYSEAQTTQSSDSFIP